MDKPRRQVRLTRPALAILVTAAVLVGGIGSYGAYRVWRHLHVPQEQLVNADQRDFTIGEQDVTIITSKTQATSPQPLALVTHGYGADERMLRAPYMAQMTQGLIDAGWIVATSEAGGDAWGGGTSQDDYVALHQAVLDEYDVDHTVMVSVSMGAIPGLNLVADERIDGLTEWVGISPVTDLAAMNAMDVWTSIIGAVLTSEQIDELNPVGLTFPDVPMTIFSAPADTIAPPAEQVAPFASSNGVTVIECAGRHVSPDCFRANEVVALSR